MCYNVIRVVRVYRGGEPTIPFICTQWINLICLCCLRWARFKFIEFLRCRNQWLDLDFVNTTKLLLEQSLTHAPIHQRIVLDLLDTHTFLFSFNFHRTHKTHTEARRCVTTHWKWCGIKKFHRLIYLVKSKMLSFHVRPRGCDCDEKRAAKRREGARCSAHYQSIFNDSISIRAHFVANTLASETVCARRRQQCNLRSSNHCVRCVRCMGTNVENVRRKNNHE